MELTAWSLVTIPLTIFAFLALLWSLVVLIRIHTPSQPFSESVLASSVISVLILNAEVYALSLLPFERPLDWLPLVHSSVVAGTIVGISACYGWDVWRRSFTHGIASAHVVWNQPLVVRMMLLCMFSIVFVSAAYGMYTVPSDWDGLEYHVPMAVQPYQEGRIGPVTSDLPWATAYPRGTETIWYWTLQWTGTTALFHTVQLAFGLQLLLATYTLARRSGVVPWSALAGCAIVTTMPIFFILSVSDYIDIAYGAGVIALLAFLAPSREQSPQLQRDWLLAACAFSQCALIKLPIVAALFGGIALLHTLLTSKTVRERSWQVWLFLRSWRSVTAGIIILFGIQSYIGHWVKENNPLYPVALTVGGRLIFEGPVDSRLFGGGANSSMGNVAEMSLVHRYYAAWADWFNPLNVDSLGSPGPLFLTVVLVSFVLFLGHALVTRQRWHLAIALMFGVAFFVPGFFLPRYGIPMLTIAIVGSTWTFQRFSSELLPGLKIILVAGCLFGLFVSSAYIRTSLQWTTNVAGNDFSLAKRTSFIAEKVQVGIPEIYQSPEMILYIRDHSKPGDTLVWNVRTFQSLLWNRTYSNQVIHLAGTQADFYPGGAYLLTEPTSDQMTNWLFTLKQMNPDQVLVYTQSAYAQYLLANPEFGYHIGYQDAASRGKGAMTLFERRNS